MALRLSRRATVAALALALTALAVPATPAGAAVVLSIPQTYTVSPGGTVTVSVNLTNDTSITPSGIGVALSFNNSVFTISNVVKGAVLDGTWSLASSTANPGILTASLSGLGTQTIAPGTGAVLTFDLTASNAIAPGTYPVNLLVSSGATTTDVEDLNGSILTTPPTAGSNDAVDGLITVNAIPEPSPLALAGLVLGLGGLKVAWSRRRAKASATA